MPSFQLGWIDATSGPVPQVAGAWTLSDHLGALAVRCSIRRMRYAVAPGLYALGKPGADAPVVVTANYKLSFDHVRRALSGRSAWILVLDTHAVNVWCAAGKGTFGTEELLARIDMVGLKEVVSHRTLILPQLGAPGVAAHEVAARSGFRIVYGPVRVEDLPEFLDNHLVASPDMRRVHFHLTDRIAVIPVELVQEARYAFFLMLMMLFLGGLNGSGYSFAQAWSTGGPVALAVMVGYLLGTVAVPVLLPWLPGRAFAVKGAVLGAVAVMGAWYGLGSALADAGAVVTMGAVSLLVPAISSFMAMNFTGASTYTSLSGVRREMRIAVPAQLVTAVLGCMTWLVALFL